MRKNTINLSWKKGNGGYFSTVSKDGRVVVVSSDGTSINGVLIKKNNFGSGVFFKTTSEIEEFIDYLRKLLKNQKFLDLLKQVKVEKKEKAEDGFLF